MGTVPSTHTWTPGETVTAALMNQVRDALDFLLSTRPLFTATQTVAQSVAEGTWTPVTFTSETIDRDNGHSTSVNTSRYTAQTPGYYRVSGTASLIMSSGRLHVTIAKNGTRIPSGVGTDATQSLAVAGFLVEQIVFLNGSTDYVELQCAQSSGAAKDTAVLSDFACRLSCEWVSN